MDNESPETVDRTIKAILRFPPVTRRIHQEFFVRAQRESGIPIAHHHVMIMVMLQDFGPLSSSELVAMVFISHAQMTQSTEKLMGMGLIEKQQDTADRRKVSIRLTPKGQAAIRRFDEIMIDLIRERIKDLSAPDLEKLSESFDYITEVFSI